MQDPSLALISYSHYRPLVALHLRTCAGTPGEPLPPVWMRCPEAPPASLGVGEAAVEHRCCQHARNTVHVRPGAPGLSLGGTERYGHEACGESTASSPEEGPSGKPAVMHWMCASPPDP